MRGRIEYKRYPSALYHLEYRYDTTIRPVGLGLNLFYRASLILRAKDTGTLWDRWNLFRVEFHGRAKLLTFSVS